MLVENYQLTAPVGLRIGWESLEHNSRYVYLFIDVSALPQDFEEEKTEDFEPEAAQPGHCSYSMNDLPFWPCTLPVSLSVPLL